MSGESRDEVYEITIEARLDGKRWSEWFDGFRSRIEGGGTVLVGPVADQTALHGILARIRDLGLPLVALRRLR